MQPVRPSCEKDEMALRKLLKDISARFPSGTKYHERRKCEGTKRCLYQRKNSQMTLMIP